MASHTNGLGDALRSRAAANGASSKTLIPTNSVTTKDGVVKVRIDPTLMVADVVKQLVANLQIKQPPSNFALRDDDDELVTNENLRRMIRSKAKLKYVMNIPVPDPRFIPIALQARQFCGRGGARDLRQTSPSRGKELSACPFLPSTLPSRRLSSSPYSCVTSLKRLPGGGFCQRVSQARRCSRIS
jgi:hypothetical protein